MKSVNKICMSVLLLGAAAIAVPAMAADAGNNANPADNAQAAPSNENAAQAAGAANESGKANESSQANAAADASTSPSAAPSSSSQTAMNNKSSSGNSQMAMNSSGNEAANFSSVGDTSKKYHRSSRAKDFRAEQKITAQLNQQASEAAKPTQTASNQ
jgi:hypothetical protein